MNDIAALLNDYGFTARDARTIAARAHTNGLSLVDVQAWINEARASTSLHNPRGFVRARIQDGDKLLHTTRTDPHVADRQRYVNQWAPLRPHKLARFKHVTRTCACGHVVYATRFCEECDLCPTCCQCELTDPDKE